MVTKDGLVTLEFVDAQIANQFGKANPYQEFTEFSFQPPEPSLYLLGRVNFRLLLSGHEETQRFLTAVRKLPVEIVPVKSTTAKQLTREDPLQRLIWFSLHFPGEPDALTCILLTH